MRRLKTRWYCFTDDEIGPFTLSDVVQKFASGALRPGDLVRTESELSWRRIETVAEITEAAHGQKLRSRPLTVRLIHLSLQLSRRLGFTCVCIALQLAIWSFILNLISNVISFLLSLFR